VRWNRHLAADATAEGAIFEALARRALAAYVDEVAPEESDTGGPDFQCRTRGLLFYVEAACVTREAMTNVTNLSDVVLRGGSFGIPTRRFEETITLKNSQGRSRADGPTILMVGTLHQQAAMVAMNDMLVDQLLVGEEQICFVVDLSGSGEGRTEDCPPYRGTELHGSAFLAADGLPGAPIGTRNRGFSAVLMATVESLFPENWPGRAPFLGILHPDPLYPLDPYRAFPGIEFRELEPNWKSGHLQVREVPCPPIDIQRRWRLDTAARL